MVPSVATETSWSATTPPPWRREVSVIQRCMLYPPHPVNPLSKPRRSHERTVLWMVVLAGLPGALVSAVLLWVGDYSARLQWTLVLFIGVVWIGLAFAIRRRVVFPTDGTWVRRRDLNRHERTNHHRRETRKAISSSSRDRSRSLRHTAWRTGFDASRTAPPGSCLPT